MTIIEAVLMCPLTDHSGGGLYMHMHIISNRLMCTQGNKTLQMQIRCIIFSYYACTDLKLDLMPHVSGLQNMKTFLHPTIHYCFKDSTNDI